MLLARRNVMRMGQPGAPGRRHARGLGDTVIDDPAPLVAHRGVDLMPPGAIILVAELVRADELALAPRIKIRAPGLTVPPGQAAQKNLFERHGFRLPIWRGLWRCGLPLSRRAPVAQACRFRPFRGGRRDGAVNATLMLKTILYA